jgi:hypothetical protein
MDYEIQIKRIKLILTPFIILFVGLFFISCSSQAPKENYVAYVNGEGIAVTLFKKNIVKYKTNVYNQFSQKYTNQTADGFWETSFENDKVPSEVLKRKALDESIRIITQQILARNKGLLEDISYSGFLNRLNSLNESRKQTVINKKVIYGPIEYTESEYFDYLLSLDIIALKEKLAREDFDISENNIRAFYNSNKNELYRKRDSMNVVQYYSFDEIQTVVRSNYIDDQYERLIDNLIATSEIEVNNDVFNQISIE